MERGIDEEFAKRQNETPDQWTLAWWRKEFQQVLAGYRGATHGTNCALAQFANTEEKVKALIQRCEALQREREADRAKIGEMIAEHGELVRKVESLEEWKEKTRPFLVKLYEERKTG